MTPLEFYSTIICVLKQNFQCMPLVNYVTVTLTTQIRSTRLPIKQKSDLTSYVQDVF